MSLNICLLTTGFGKGGAENQLYKLAVFLKGMGHDVVICSLIERNMFTNELKESKIHYYSPAFPKGKASLRGFFNLIHFLMKLQPDVLVSFMYSANIAGRMAGIFLRKTKIITSIRNEKVGGKGRDLLFRLTNFLDDAVTTNSEVVAKKLSSRKVVDRKSIRVIHNSVELPINRQKYPSSNENKFFEWIAVGHFRPQKDYMTLFKAISIIKDHKFKIRIAGNLFQQDWPKETIKKLGIEENVELLGIVEDMSIVYTSANAMVMSSAWEGLPNAILEAMSYGIPVVSTDVGGVSEIVQDDSGIKCEPNDPIALSNAMLKMMNIPATNRFKMGEAAIKRIKENYEPSVIMDRWQSLISQV